MQTKLWFAIRKGEKMEFIDSCSCSLTQKETEQVVEKFKSEFPKIDCHMPVLRIAQFNVEEIEP